MVQTVVKTIINDMLRELEELLIAPQFDYLLVAGDFNTDVGHSPIFTKKLLDFADSTQQHACIDEQKYSPWQNEWDTHK